MTLQPTSGPAPQDVSDDPADPCRWGRGDVAAGARAGFDAVATVAFGPVR